VKIRNFTHKGLKRLYTEDSARGVPPESADKLRKMLAFLDEMEDAEELRSLPAWKVHTLTGDRKGTWSLSVTANVYLSAAGPQRIAPRRQRLLRLTFRIDLAEREIYDIDLEDYH
jgi:proteic killer suppression protein